MQIWFFWPKSSTSYGADKLNFPEFWVKMAKMTLKVKVNCLHFSTNWEYPMMHVKCIFGIPAQICELSCGQSKVYGRTDGRKDRLTDTGNNNIPLAWKAKG